MGLDMKTKKKLTEETAKRYCRAGKKQKSTIIDEFTATTGYNRKYAIHILKNAAKMKKQYDKFTFYGMGPDENYIDRDNGARLGVYTSTAQGNFTKYLNPQECGNRTGVRYVNVYEENGTGLNFTATKQPFEMSVLPYNAYELDNAMHREELPESTYTWVRIAAKQMGVGGDDSWGAPVHQEFKISSEEAMTLEFIINSL